MLLQTIAGVEFVVAVLISIRQMTPVRRISPSPSFFD
jgi:hypothetical protein